jgi:hypothetical protein
MTGREMPASDEISVEIWKDKVDGFVINFYNAL